ncbi:DUF2490 domain-containing protein [Sphingomonas sp.]|uniref:DUF2490 domain-containing protein n=1 Tax=Sphingomonas sp. TaxID=28214 RepID=UPI001EB1887F|nr:DUF2490 domain-containing protein [Sphingomonas sp.]MBX3594827.1 DUF2490 domain-containing protein [Sphingomonas sp.]
MPFPALAQDADRELWLTGSVKVPVASGTVLELETVNRISDDSGGLYETELAGGLSHRLGDGWSLGGGYVRVVNRSRGVVTRGEDRLRIQIGRSTRLGAVQLSGRLRLERRTTSTGSDVGYRLRPQVKAALPLAERLALFASHESLIPLDRTDWGETGRYDRMRNMVGLSWKANRTLAIEAGYLNQYRYRRAGRRDTMDHVLSIGIGLTL